MAAQTTVYRCVSSSGAIALQDQPCAAGQQQEQRRIRSIEGRTPSPAPTAAADTATPAPPPAAAPIHVGDPPPLWRCVDQDGAERFADGDDRRGRWVPAWVVGADPRAPQRMFNNVGANRPKPPGSRPAGPSTAEVGVPGPMVYIEDQCWQLDARQACMGYREQLEAAERQRYNRTGDDARAASTAAERLAAIVQRYCG